MRAAIIKPSTTSGTTAEGFENRINNSRSKPATASEYQSIKICEVCIDALSDSFIRSPDGRCHSCVDYRRKFCVLCRYYAAAHSATVSLTRPQSRYCTTRRVYVTA